MLRRLCSTLVIASISTLGIAPACGLPEGDQDTPSAAHYRLVEVRAAGDLDGTWELLDPGARAELERWLLAEKLTLNEINTAYPAQDKAAALKAIGGGERAELLDAKALFERVALSGAAAPLGSLQTLGARVSSEEIAGDGASAIVHTYGGDQVHYVKGDGDRWYFRLPAAEMERLASARARAEANLAQVRANLNKLQKQP